MGRHMTVKELLSQLQNTFADAGAWFAELACKLGLSSNCVYQDWKDLTVGQAGLIAFLGFAVVSLVLDKWAVRKFLAFCAALVAGGAFLIAEIYLVDYIPASLPGVLLAFPFNLVWLFLCALLPFFAASLVGRSVLIRLTRIP
jgi:hypothetical protein